MMRDEIEQGIQNLPLVPNRKQFREFAELCVRLGLEAAGQTLSEDIAVMRAAENRFSGAHDKFHFNDRADLLQEYLDDIRAIEPAKVVEEKAP